MKTTILIFLLGCFFHAFPYAKDTLFVNGQAFLLIKTTGDSDNHSGKDTILNLYRLEGKNKVFLLKHFIYTAAADCDSFSRYYGSYKVNGNKLVFYTEYDVDRSKNFGIPAREKEVYEVKPNGKLIRLYSITTDDIGNNIVGE